jgi:ribonuclease VapC
VVIDSSALLAIVLDEPERASLVARIEASPRGMISAASFIAASIVILNRRGEAAVSELREFVNRAGIEIAPIDVRQAESAIEAFRRFGKGRHPAGLNFGDCFAYALAVLTGEPLLFKGEEFAKTDIAAA